MIQCLAGFTVRRVDASVARRHETGQHDTEQAHPAGDQ
jgi:hypothetical protein